MQLRRGLDILEDLVDGWQLPEVPPVEYLRKVSALAGLQYDAVVALAEKTFCRPTTHVRDAHDEFIWAVKDAIRATQSIENESLRINQVSPRETR